MNNKLGNLIEINHNPKNIDKDYFNDYGGDLYENNYSRYTYDPVRIIDDLVDHGIMPETLLDLGCATGHLVSDFRELGVRAYGIENDENIMAKSVCPQFCKVMDIRDLSSIKDAQFDIIYANSLMYFMPQELTGEHGILKDLHRICHKAVYLCNPFKGETYLSSDPYRKFLAKPSWWAKQFEEAGFKKLTNRIYKKI